MPVQSESLEMIGMRMWKCIESVLTEEQCLQKYNDTILPIKEVAAKINNIGQSIIGRHALQQQPAQFVHMLDCQPIGSPGCLRWNASRQSHK